MATMVNAGDKAPNAGIYRCTRCGKEATLAVGDAVTVCSKCGNKQWELKG